MREDCGSPFFKRFSQQLSRNKYLLGGGKGHREAAKNFRGFPPHGKLHFDVFENPPKSTFFLVPFKKYLINTYSAKHDGTRMKLSIAPGLI